MEVTTECVAFERMFATQPEDESLWEARKT